MPRHFWETSSSMPTNVDESKWAITGPGATLERTPTGDDEIGEK
jgi:hypothetical protein